VGRRAAGLERFRVGAVAAQNGTRERQDRITVHALAEAAPNGIAASAYDLALTITLIDISRRGVGHIGAVYSNGIAQPATAFPGRLGGHSCALGRATFETMTPLTGYTRLDPR
jgi:hypothetical protein